MEINDHGIIETPELQVKELHTLSIDGAQEPSKKISSLSQQETCSQESDLTIHEITEQLDETQFKQTLEGGCVIYECNQCSKPIQGLYRLRRHMSVHLRSLTCHICEKVFKNTEEYQTHMLQHQNLAQKFVCDQCGQTFKRKFHLDRHINTSHTSEKLYFCSQCPMSYGRRDYLKKHLINKHSIFEVPQGCEINRKKDDQKILDQERNLNSSRINMETGDSNHNLDEIIPNIQNIVESQVKNNNETQLEEQLVDVDYTLVYKCNQCSKKVLGLHGFRKHLTTHNKTCEICKKVFKDHTKLLQHMVIHSDHKRFGCSHCPQRFHRKQQLREHFLVIHKGFKSFAKSFTCDICQKVTQGYNDHKKHIQTHSNEKPFQCSQCSLAFKRKYHLNRHAATHSSNKPFACPYCSLSYGRGDHLNRHLELYHSSSELLKEYHGLKDDEDTNGESVSKIESKNIEVKMENNDEIEFGEKCINTPSDTYIIREIQTFACSICGLVNEDEKLHQEHELTHSIQYVKQEKEELSEPSSKCNICNQIIPTKHRQRHKLVHSEERPYKCLSCPKTFKRSDHLKRHNLLHENEESANMKIKSERTEETLENYTDGIDGEVCLPVLDESQFNKTITGGDVMYECNQCPRVFKGLGRLRLHIVVHEKPTSYQCKICHKVFRTSECLQHHMIIHSDQKKFGCDECGRRFHRKFELTNHVDIVHKKIKTAPWLAKRSHFTCPICSVVILSIHQKRHMKSHDDFRPFTCALCSQTFKRKYHLDRHVHDVHRIRNADIEDGRSSPEESQVVKNENHESFNEEVTVKTESE